MVAVVLGGDHWSVLLHNLIYTQKKKKHPPPQHTELKKQFKVTLSFLLPSAVCGLNYNRNLNTDGSAPAPSAQTQV